jgi:hypothetical protein
LFRLLAGNLSPGVFRLLQHNLPQADTALPFHYFRSVARWGKIKPEVHVEFMKVHCNSLKIGWAIDPERHHERKIHV